MADKLIAPAKVNLALRVLGKKIIPPFQHYHLIQSLVVFAAMGDTITITRANTGGVRLIVSGTIDYALLDNNNNSITRTIRLCEQYSDQKFHGHIHVEKNIPLGGGLGGGTSDAIALLRYLARRWSIPLADQQKLAAEIGADGPVILYGQSALVSGIGDVIAPFFPPAWLLTASLLLISGGQHCPTDKIFALKNTSSTLPGGAWDQPINNSEDKQEWRNGLMAAAMTLHPSLAHLDQLVGAQENCLHHGMSGSGGCFYALFADNDSAITAAHNLRAQQLWVAITQVQQPEQAG
ncbi:MAG: hypothetical protein ORN57_05130 [Alphaproteobacteria bacterium]|nr:hypothetical protein [Alphaproteobacteria bacterium]